MSSFPATPELLAVARRVVWFQPPEETLSDGTYFLAHVMTYGTVEDLRAVTKVAGPAEFREALDKAPAGVFDARSWAYWNLKYCGGSNRPLPIRRGIRLE